MEPTAKPDAHLAMHPRKGVVDHLEGAISGITNAIRLYIGPKNAVIVMPVLVALMLGGAASWVWLIIDMFHVQDNWCGHVTIYR